MYNQEKVLSLLHKNFSTMKDLRLTEDEFERYDIESEKFIVEVKSRTPRNSMYDDCMIEEIKYNPNVNDGRQFIYAVIRWVAGDRILYLWDITQMTKDGYDFQWYNKDVRKTTYFNNNEKVDKRLGKVYYKDAKYKISINTGKRL